MNTLRKLLFPFSVLYRLVTLIRNKCFDIGIFTVHKFDIPIISVGNLSVGGTGKTPHIEYLIRLLQSSKKVAVLSRGYKRQTKGFVLAKNGITVNDIGDEPFQYFSKFKDIIVAVDEKRVNGIKQLLKLPISPDVILLDDAYQHRSVKPGLSILLTSFNELFIDDFILPVGNLRESKMGYKRADIIVITKCPEALDDEQQQTIVKKIKPYINQEIFFSKITYQNKLQGYDSKVNIQDLKNYEVLLITGIANPNPLIQYLKIYNKTLTHLKYPDHHNFTKNDLEKINKTYSDLTSEKKLILTTEKDYVRIFAALEKCYYIAIETRIINNEDTFSKKIKNYVG